MICIWLYNNLIICCLFWLSLLKIQLKYLSDCLKWIYVRFHKFNHRIWISRNAKIPSMTLLPCKLYSYDISTREKFLFYCSLSITACNWSFKPLNNSFLTLSGNEYSDSGIICLIFKPSLINLVNLNEDILLLPYLH